MKLPVATQEPYRDPYFYANVKQAETAASRISAMIKTLIETPPIPSPTHTRTSQKFGEEKQQILAYL